MNTTKEITMQTKARKAVMTSGAWLTAAEVSCLAGLSGIQLEKWKEQGMFFSINHLGVDYFPIYGLDRQAGFQPVTALAKIIATFEGRKDGWGMAYWFESVNSFLGGQRPRDLLASDGDRVIVAAEDEVQEITHG